MVKWTILLLLLQTVMVRGIINEVKELYIYIYVKQLLVVVECGQPTIQTSVFYKRYTEHRTSKCPDALRKQLRTYVWQSHVMLGTGTTTLGDARARGWTPE